MALKTYIPGEMAVIIGTTIVIDYERLSVEYDEDFWSFYTGSGGEVTRTKNSSRLGMMTVELPQTSEANLELSAAANSDAPITASIIDTNGFSVHTIGEATVMRIPTAEYQKTESGTREWALKGSLDINTVGGN